MHLVVCTSLLLALAVPGHARPQILVVLADHLTLADVSRPVLPAIAQMERKGQMCLLSPGLARGHDPIGNVYATLGAGDSIPEGDLSQGLLGQALASAHVRTALIGNADGDETGVFRPARLLLPAPDHAPIADGTQADPGFPGGRRVDPGQLWSLAQDMLRFSSLVVVHDGDLARIEREKEMLLPSVYDTDRCSALQALDAFLMPCLRWADGQPERCVMLVVPTAPLRAGKWDSLTPYFRYGQLSGMPDRDGKPSIVQSSTTQTWGLAAARDIAPTILSIFALTPPLQMTGAPLESSEPVPVSKASARLERLDRLTRLNQQAQAPFFWMLGFAAGIVLFASIGLYLSGVLIRSAWAQQTSCYGLRALSAVPLALLLSPLLPAPTLRAYFTIILGGVFLLALLSSPAVILSVTSLLLIGDGLSGTALVSQSLLSVYALSGIRFYGIGNEYMGVLLAGTLSLAGTRIFANRRSLRTGLLFVVATLVLSCPAFGAKAGGAVTATATFLVAWRLLRGLPGTGKHVLVGIAAGFALVFLWAALGHWLPLRRTHIDSAVQAFGGGRFGYIAGVALRKIGLAVQVTLHPGTLLGLLGVALLGLLGHFALRRSVTEYGRRHPRFAAVWRAGLWGSLVCLLFNDSGIVAAILLLLSLSLALLHGMISDVRPRRVADNLRVEKGAV